jgi:hypothetical protein
VEDLPRLIELWQLEQLPVAELEKRFTDFQVVEGGDGKIAACLGIQLAGNAGKLYGEAIASPERADELRDLLWERVQMVCRNHGIDRLWTAMSLPYWRARGFEASSDENLARLPELFREEGARWQSLALRSADASGEAIEKQFAMLKAMHQSETQRLQRRAKLLKTAALVLTVIVFGLVLAWAVVLLKWGPQFLQRR